MSVIRRKECSKCGWPWDIHPTVQLPNGGTATACVGARCITVEYVPAEQLRGAVYPRDEGDVTVIGPECFATKDGSVLCWRGVNYVPQQQLQGAVDLLHDVATSGVSYDESRVRYVEVQIDRETWEALAAYRGGQ